LFCLLFIMPKMLASFAVLFCVIATHNFVGAQWTPDLLSAYWELELDLFEGAVPSCDRDIILVSCRANISASGNVGYVSLYIDIVLA
jgi:hypothetical protein